MKNLMVSILIGLIIAVLMYITNTKITIENDNFKFSIGSTFEEKYQKHRGHVLGGKNE